MAFASGMFPVSGGDIIALLESKFGGGQLWVVRRIETLSDERGELLGDLWRRAQAGGVQITTSDLCAALRPAIQVVTLDMHLQVDPAKEFLIEDGVAIRYASD